MEKAEFVMHFVYWNVDYTEDIDSHGHPEYYQFPLETLYYGYGDCEDSAFLLCSLYRIMGMDTAVLLNAVHCAAGVAVDLEGTTFSMPFSDVGYFETDTFSMNFLGSAWMDHYFVLPIGFPYPAIIMLIFSLFLIWAGITLFRDE